MLKGQAEVSKALYNLILVRYEYDEVRDANGMKFRDRIDALIQGVIDATK